VVLTNPSGHALRGPLALVLSGLPAGVILSNASGSYQGNAYLDLVPAGGVLNPWQEVVVTLLFTVTGPHKHFGRHYDLDVFAGI
jgi:hypothetical protein